jgi:hypothetical protein
MNTLLCYRRKANGHVYEEYILNEAAAATDRRKYKGVCKLIKDYSDAGAKEEARDIPVLLNSLG